MVFEWKVLNVRGRGGIQVTKQRRDHLGKQTRKTRQQLVYCQRVSQNNFNTSQALLQEKADKTSTKSGSYKLQDRPSVPNGKSPTSPSRQTRINQQKPTQVSPPDEVLHSFEKNQKARIKTSQEFLQMEQSSDLKGAPSKQQQFQQQQQQQIQNRSQQIHQQQQLQQRFPQQSSQMMKRPRKFTSRKIDLEPSAMETRETVRVRFSIQIKVEWGQSLRIVGSCDEMGSWQVKNGLDMKWSDGDIWRVEVRLPSDTVVGYKYVVIGADGQACSWQNGNNSVLVVDAKAGQVLQVVDNWGAQPGAMVRNGQQVTTREKALTQWSEQMSGTVQSQRQEIRRSRMELFEARQELQESTQECARLRAELAAVQKERLEAAKSQRRQQREEEKARAEALKVRIEMKQLLEHATEILQSDDS